MNKWLTPKPKVTVIGSFHRELHNLRDLLIELESTNCRVLSPIDIDFENSQADFVKLKSEEDLSVLEIEKFVLRSIAVSNFIWLHAPDGYVGLSAAFEMGYATKLKKPIFCKNSLEDISLKEFVFVKNSVFDALNMFR